MTKLHEVLAAENTVVATAQKIHAETLGKFNRFSEFFVGAVRSLKRIGSELADREIEASAARVKAMPTDVIATLEYALPVIGKMLNVKAQKHRANQLAQADLIVGGKTLVAGAPVDFLLDLEAQIPQLRALFEALPTLDPTRVWKATERGRWQTEPMHTAQTEKEVYGIVLSPATDKHPAQIKEASREKVVGTFTDIVTSGAATTDQKANVLAFLDELQVAVKQARMRANMQEATGTADGTTITKEILAFFK